MGKDCHVFKDHWLNLNYTCCIIKQMYYSAAAFVCKQRIKGPFALLRIFLVF